jgi:hypothetical protein
VSEPNVEDQTLTTTFANPLDQLAITNTTLATKKAAGADSSGLRKLWLPTLDNLRCAKESLVFLIGCKSQLSKV